MPSNADILLGKIAVKLNFLTEDKLAAAVKLQEKTPARSLGSILVEQKLLSQDQLTKCLEIQKQKMQTPTPASDKKTQAALFGKLVVARKLATPEQVNECLRLQEADTAKGGTKTLGEVMVEKGYLKPEQVRQVLSSQQKKTMACPKCKLSFTVVTTSATANVKCPKCKGPLQEATTTAPVKTDAEFGTMIARTVDLQLGPKPAAPATSTANMVQTKCVICDNEFTGAKDGTGRVKCPKCMSTFSPRR